MATQSITLSDITGKMVDEENRVTLIIKKHPSLDAPVRLDAGMSELERLDAVSEVVVIQVIAKDDEGQDIAVPVETFEALFTGNVLDVLKNAPPVRAAKAGSQKVKRDSEELAAIRTWCKANGWSNLKDKGRIPAEAEEAYRKAHAS